ncbi:hypothetical protein RJ639_028427 [Escallonia herrerae]|uniref:HAT C-terminal dimerisation domain-containing protein n=1 Tax=Escallonia herrerae TaxID=1293975 RepID=A0AA88X5L8_9ASTE|nr:hypothetical protein RJ639_028427 [Escallonia herrerae]
MENVMPIKSDLETYLEEGVYICEMNLESQFDVIGWWKVNNLKYKIFSQMAINVLSIPITTVVSEAAFTTDVMNVWKNIIVDDRISSPTNPLVDAPTQQALGTEAFILLELGMLFLKIEHFDPNHNDDDDLCSNLDLWRRRMNAQHIKNVFHDFMT